MFDEEAFVGDAILEKQLTMRNCSLRQKTIMRSILQAGFFNPIIPALLNAEKQT